MQPDPLTVSLDTFIEKDLTFDPEVEAVIVGFDENFSYPKMVKATTYLERPGSIFIGTNLDERIPMPNHVLPSTGTFIKCIETSAERRAVIMGKPSTMITDIYFKELIKNGPKKFLMIGDRMNTDVLFGKNNQFQTLMVETGVHKMHDIMKISIALQTGAENQDLQYQIPDFITESLTDLLEYLDWSIRIKPF